MGATPDLDQTLSILAKIDTTAKKICHGIELFDPDRIGRDLISQLDELAELMADHGPEKSAYPEP